MYAGHDASHVRWIAWDFVLVLIWDQNGDGLLNLLDVDGVGLKIMYLFTV